jgi:hypothetical protein
VGHAARVGEIERLRLPIILLILLAILIAQFGFWDALGAVLGVVAMLSL